MTFSFKTHMPLLILSFLLLSACSQGQGPTDYGPNPLPGGTISAELATYVDAFESRYNANISFAVAFDSVSQTGGDNASGGTTVGVCRVYSNGAKEVLINRSFWDSTGNTALGEAKRVVLIFHELGHCYFDRSHDDRKYSNGMSVTMMNSLLNPTLNFWANYNSYYLNELANPSSKDVLIAQEELPPNNSNWAAGYEESGVTVRESHTDANGACSNVVRHYDAP